MHQFPALPWPLRSVIGARARMLDADLRRLANSADNCHYHSIDVALEGDDLAADGFHPSEIGYARWAEDLSRQLTPELRAARHE